MPLSPPRPLPDLPWLLLLPLALAGGAAPEPHQVSGVLGGSVLLSPRLPPNKTARKVEWSFSGAAGPKIQVAELGPGGSGRPDPRDRFEGRLEVLGNLTLRIRALRRGDRGLYEARIKLLPELLDQTFNLSVYAPVPVPHIQPQRLSLTARGCNVTLRCSVPAGSDAKVAWQQETPWGELGEGNQTLQLAVPSGAYGSSYTCVAWNPLQQQSNSIHLGTLCQQLETRGWRRWHLCLLLLLLLLGALLGIFCLWRRMRRKERGKKATLPSTDAPQEPFYALVQSTGSLQAQELPPAHPSTIYSKVQSCPKALT